MATTTATAPAIDEPRVVLQSVSWDAYEAVLAALDGCHARITYDRGTLEIMSPSPRHEGFARAFERLIDVLAIESGRDHTSWGSMTFRKQALERGLEPDCCFYIDNWRAVAHGREIGLEDDPPPDLAIEIEASRSVAIDRLALYAAFGVAELWRFDGEQLTVHVLVAGGYEVRERSPLFPAIPPDGLVPFLQRYGRESIRSWITGFRAWVRERLMEA